MPRRRPGRAAVVAAAAVALAGGAGVTALAAAGNSAPAYRTAQVGRGLVTSTLDATGTAEPVSRVTASFANRGPVVAVLVRAGQSVTAGQTLAQQDLTPLIAALDAAKAATANASLTLAKAEAGTLSAVAAGGGAGSASRIAPASATSAVSGSSSISLLATTTSAAVTPAVARATRPSGGRPAGGASAGSATALITGVTAGQHALDLGLAAAAGLLTAATNACASTPTGTASSSSSRTPGPTARPTTTAAPAPTAPPVGSAPTQSASPTGGQPGGSGGPAACLRAERSLLAAQQRVAAEESGLAAAEVALDDALVRAASTPPPASTASTPAPRVSSGARSAGSPSATAGTARSAASGPVAITAPQLAAYQARVDAAAAAEAVAAQNLQLGTLTSPISGTVLSVGVTAGSEPGSAGIVVSAPDGMVFTSAIPVTNVPQVAVGQAVSVLPDGSSLPLAGRVVAVAPGPDGTGAYPVTVGLTGQPTGIRTGSTAALTVSLASASGDLTVPTSAVTAVGRLHLVRVLSGHTLHVVRVTVQLQGAVLTEVSGALSVGETVVLADLNAPVPASNVTPRAAGSAADLGADLAALAFGLPD